MLRQHRWARVACFFAGVLVAFQIYAQVPVFGPRTKQPPPAALASPVIATPAAGPWGVFERLVGQELKSNAGGYSVRFSWVRPGEELLQEWVHPRTGKVMGTAVTVRDPATGQLREGKTAAASATGYLGTLAADGSVGFLKGSSGYRWQLAADGFVERADLKLAGGQVVAKPVSPYARWALPVVASTVAVAQGAAAPLPAAVVQGAPAPPPVTVVQGAAAPPAPLILAGGPAQAVAPVPTTFGAARVVDLPPGVTVPGKLAATAETDAQGRPFRCYAINVSPGTRVKAALTSKEFPPLLRLAPGNHCGSAKVVSTGQAQQGKAQLAAVIADGGNHLLLVGSATPGTTGRFLVTLESEGTVAGAGGPAAPSRVAAMRAQTAAYQAELDRRANDERLRREREAQEARAAAEEQRAAEERRAANFKRALEELANIANSVPK